MLNGNLLWERACVLSIWAVLMRGIGELGRAATTRTFILIVFTPFVAWAGVIMWVHARFPDEAVRAVVAGPSVVLLVWAVLVSAWFCLTVGLCAARHSVAVGLGLLVLFVLYVTAVQLMPLQDALRATDPSALPATLPPDEVR